MLKIGYLWIVVQDNLSFAKYMQAMRIKILRFYENDIIYLQIKFGVHKKPQLQFVKKNWKEICNILFLLFYLTTRCGIF